MSKPAGPPVQRSYVWPVAIAVIVILGVVAVILAKNSTDKTSEAVDKRQTSTVKVSGTALPAQADGEADTAVGTGIPTIEGTDFAGDPVKISGNDGAQIIMFVAHWCPHCQKELPIISDHVAQNPLPDDVRMTMVSTSVKPDADNYPPQPWIEGAGWEGNTLVDSETNEAATALGLASFPYFIAVRNDGTVAMRTSGEITTDQFDALVAAAQEPAAS